MIDGFSVHALYEAELVGDLGGVGHEVADPCAALAVLLEGFNRSEEELAVGIAGHGAEALVADVAFRHRGIVELLEFGFVVPEVAVGGGAVLEEVDDALGLGGDLADVGGDLFVTLGCSGEAFFTKERGEGCGTDAGGTLAEEVAAVDVALVLCERINRRWT